MADRMVDVPDARKFMPMQSVPSHAGPDSINVLVLDDSRFDAERIARQCRQTDLPVVVEAVEDIDGYARALATRRFDLIFVDYLMPEVDGLQACKLLRENGASNAGCPVVMVAGAGRHDVAVQAMKSGCIDYVTKDEIGSGLIRDLLLRSVGAVAEFTRETIRADLETHRQEIHQVIRDALRELLPLHVEARETARVRAELENLGLVEPGVGRAAWDDILASDYAGFDFKKLKH
jgi:PleD family two-component response regulator